MLGRARRVDAPDALPQGIFGTVPIVAATVPLAAGAAMAYKLRREARVAVAFFGDGALEEGPVHESMNLAAVYRLPVVFVCENNLYSSHLHWSERRVADNLDRAGEFHSIPGERVDGNDVRAVYVGRAAAAERARAGNGPGFLECRTFRWRGHVGASYDLDVGVRRRGELEQWVAKDPLRRAESELLEDGVADLAVRQASIESRIGLALARARAAPNRRARAPPNMSGRRPRANAKLRPGDSRGARPDAGLGRPRVPDRAGPWSPWYAGASLEDLDREFGRERILDSPVSENATTGLAIGAALSGMRPVVFHPRMDFMLLAADPS